MTEYVKGSKAIIEKCHAEECSKDKLFSDAYEELMDEYNEFLPCIGGIIVGLILRGILHNWTFTCAWN